MEVDYLTRARLVHNAVHWHGGLPKDLAVLRQQQRALLAERYQHVIRSSSLQRARGANDFLLGPYGHAGQAAQLREVGRDKVAVSQVFVGHCPLLAADVLEHWNAGLARRRRDQFVDALRHLHLQHHARGAVRPAAHDRFRVEVLALDSEGARGRRKIE